MMNVLKTSVRVSRISVTSNRYNKALCHNEYIQTFLTLFKRVKNLVFRNKRKASNSISIVDEAFNNVVQMRRTSRFCLSGQGHHRTQHQDLYINTYLGSNGDIKITQMTVIERSSGTLHTNYYGAVTFRPLGVPKRRLAESAESESGCRIWLSNLAVEAGCPETSRTRAISSRTGARTKSLAPGFILVICAF